MGKKTKNKDSTSLAERLVGAAVGDNAPVPALVDTRPIGEAKRTASWYGKIKDAVLALALGFAVVSILRSPEPAALELPSAARVDALLAHRAVLHVGGQHRGGTTILWRALAAAGHADAAAAAAAAGDDFANWGDGSGSGGELPGRPALVAFDPRLACVAQRRFGCKGAVFGCSCMEAEGLFVQSVLPTWRLGQASNGDGLGRFALANRSRLSEADLRAGDREQLFADWAPLWGLPLDPPSRGAGAKGRHQGGQGLFGDARAADGGGREPPAAALLREVLLEKTPSTTRTVRFLDALWAAQGDLVAFSAAAAVGTGPLLTPPRPMVLTQPARFVFTSRHPLAAALALDAFTTARGISLHARVAHWLAVEESLGADLRAPAAAAASQGAGGRPGLRFILHRKLTLERLACRPAQELAGVLAWLGLAGWDAARVAHAARAAAALVHAAPNAKHAAEYARRRRAPGGRESFERAHADLLEAFARRVAAVDTGDRHDRYDLGRIGGVLPCGGDPSTATVEDEF